MVVSKNIDLEETLINHIQRLNLKKICVSLSGGLDSIVLLHILHQIAREQIYLRAIHFNHNLTEGSQSWAQFCKKICNQLNVNLDIYSLKINLHEGFGIEAAARKARYQKLGESIHKDECLMTAHHQDDQLETILLRMARGTGIDGLQAIQRQFDFGQGIILRPLLDFTRDQIEDYAKRNKLEWIEDTSNKEVYFDRNFLRQKVIPIMKERWPSLPSSVSRLSKISSQTLILLKELAEQDLGKDSSITELNIDVFNDKSNERVINMMRYLISRNKMSSPSMRVLNAGINILLNDESINPSMFWDDCCIKRYRNKLYFLHASQLKPNQNLEPENWKIKNPLRLDNDGGLLEVTLVRGQGLSLSKCDQNLTIRYRIGGESIKPVGHKITKKLKNLFQENHILPWVRDKIPLIYSGTELIGVADLWIHDDYTASQNEQGFLIDWQRKINIKHNC